MFNTSIQRRHLFGVIGGAIATLGAPAVHSQSKRVRLILGIPTMLPIVANQTSVPTALGYYEQEGIIAEPVLAGAGGTSSAVQLVARGDQDIGSASYTPLLVRAGEGQDMGISFFYLQVRAFVISLATPADSLLSNFAQLKGKLVGVSALGSETSAVLRFLARESGLNLDTDLRQIAVGTGAQAAQALRAREVDAYIAPRSQLAQIEALGLKLKQLPLPNRLRYLFGPGLFARRDYIERNRATVVGMGRAVAKGTVFMMTNPEAAIRLHWKAYPQQVPQGMPFEQALGNALQTLRVQIDGLRFQDHEQVTRFGEYRTESVRDLMDVYGLTDRIQNPARIFNNDLIAEINNFDKEKIIQQAQSFKA